MFSLREIIEKKGRSSETEDEGDDRGRERGRWEGEEKKKGDFKVG